MLTYCTNVHPAEGWADVQRNLADRVLAVRDRFSPGERFPLGLWLSRRALDECEREPAGRFAGWCEEHDCFVATLNGFPYGRFHGPAVKERVYLPDWRDPRRADYTVRLAGLLAGWLPAGLAGSISTLPVGWQPFLEEGDLPAVRGNLLRVLRALDRLREERGRTVVLALEPEPGCWLETTADVVAFVARLELPARLRPLLGACYDACHLAVVFEEAAAGLDALAAAGIPLAKVQASSALRCEGRDAAALARFADDTYLHQTVVRGEDGRLQAFPDLPAALAARDRLGPGGQWRVHHHLPVFLAAAGPGCGTTGGFLEEVLRRVGPEVLVEVETYTWEVLPDSLDCGGLVEGMVPVRTVTPAVTCSVQATFLTGRAVREHGIVANGWYFRDLSEVWLWRQSNRLVQGDKVWHLGRRRDPGFTCASLFWWFNMVTDADWSVTPRPVYTADGRKLPDCYSDPPELRGELTASLGRFPLFSFWGPATSLASTEWIAEAARRVEEAHRPALHLVYLPHLDYVLQREGPSGDVTTDLRELDALCGRLLTFFSDRGCRVVVLSEYGVTDVRGVVHPNRILRRAGLLAVKEDLGRDYLDPGRSRAFAVSDHQVAHVYVADPADVARVRELFEGRPGIGRVLDEAGKRELALDHPRSGELVLLARPDHWLTYYFWTDGARAPDYARTVDIHRKPGYDPCELFVDPALRWPRLRIAAALLRRALGLRHLLEVTPLDASLVRGSHGRVTDALQAGPLLMTSEPRLLGREVLDAGDVCSLLLDHVFVE